MERTRSLGRESKKSFVFSSKTWLELEVEDKRGVSSTLDDELQDALKEYLIAKGIGVSLTNFLLHYLHKREHEQYMNWLKKGEAAFVAKEGSLRESSELHS
ncbi:hypothetical protein JHK85_054328 [Glycine max]|nr:hypothetical protein JHK85_054328 [Glycine max]